MSPSLTAEWNVPGASDWKISGETERQARPPCLISDATGVAATSKQPVAHQPALAPLVDTPGARVRTGAKSRNAGRLAGVQGVHASAGSSCLDPCVVMGCWFETAQELAIAGSRPCYVGFSFGRLRQASVEQENRNRASQHPDSHDGLLRHSTLPRVFASPPPQGSFCKASALLGQPRWISLCLPVLNVASCRSGGGQAMRLACMSWS